MSTRHLPPERRAEIARNASLARKGGGNRGPAPCHSPNDPTCRRCRARASEKRSRAAKKAHEAHCHQHPVPYPGCPDCPVRA